MTKKPAKTTDTDRRALIAYFATLAILTIFAFFPEGRVWGFNWWAYYPIWVPIGLLLIGIVVPWSLNRTVTTNRRDDNERMAQFWAWGGCIGLIFVAGFAFLFNRTHFLGDGYSLISLLAAEQPLVKYREIGESMSHIWVRDLLGGGGESAVLLSYRVISIVSGALFAVATYLVASRLFNNYKAALLFMLGMLSGGYTLLFFGYVENYSLLALSVALYVYIGIFVAQERISRWWVLLPQAAAAAMHIFGVIFVPATIYLLVRDSPINRWLGRIRPWGRWTVGAVVAAIIAIAFAYATHVNFFFRIAVMPFVPHQFTMDDYTLFSMAHLVDLVNLFFLFLPGSLVYLIAVRSYQNRADRTKPWSIFLALAIVCSFGTAFIFDPKLGMPRDWDLFAFAGFPLLAFVLRSLLDRKKPYLRVAILIIVVNLLVLGPRVVSQIVPDISIAHALNYKELDIQKSRPLYVSLTKILKERGDSAQERKLAAEFHERYPEFRESEYLVAQMGKRPADEIIALGRRILKRSPFTQSVWGNMGLSFVSLGMLDSAIHYYRIADALNPGTPTITSNLAAAYVRKGELDKAERLLNKAISADSTQPQFYYYKSRIAGMRGDREEYLKQLAKAASWPNSPLMYLTELSEYYLRTGDAYHARGILDTALSRGLDSAIIDSLAVRYPGQLK